MSFTSLTRLLARAALVPAIALSSLAQAQPAPANPTHPYGPGRAIPGRYIVVFKQGSDASAAAELVRAHGGQLRHTYSGALSGFAASLPEAALQGIRNNPNVVLIEQDHTVSLQLASPQNQATWGLDRIDQVDLPLDTQFHFSQTGAGVTAFIIDTGIRADHTEFTGRIKPGVNLVPDAGGTNDCHGHGTHVAGTVGGTTWGVAKGVSLVPVRVMDCTGNGSWSDIIAGIDWVASNTARPAVANMSLGGAASAAVDAAVAGAVAKGVNMVVAAGNSNVDACTTSPAREPSAITVGATAADDTRAWFSNTGTCLDLFAPGLNISSASYASTTGSTTMSGTSMAAPHVTGAAALMLQANPGASPAAIANALVSGATPNHVKSPGTGSPNLLLATLGSGAPVVQPSTKTVAIKSIAGSSSRTGGNWRAYAAVSVRDIATGAAVPNATVTGSFSAGGNASCVTGTNGSCTLGSGAIKNNAASSTTLTGTGISGSLMAYDASQNAVTQIVISRP